MGKHDKKDRSTLYYFTLSVVLSLLAAAAMSQGQAIEHAPTQAVEL